MFMYTDPLGEDYQTWVKLTDEYAEQLSTALASPVPVSLEIQSLSIAVEWFRRSMTGHSAQQYQQHADPDADRMK